MKEEEIVELTEDLSGSSLYSEGLAPIPKDKRTWTMWSLAALWVGMAVCIPTYLLASYMMKEGMGWLESLIIIGVANLVITIPMVLNGHAGVKYGVPFPVLGRSSFGTKGVHLASVTRGIVACGWFGIQTWIGGMALYEIIYAFSDGATPVDLNWLMFACFGAFWFMNMFFIWKGTDSIKWLEEYSAPILILMGVALIGWGAYNTGGFGVVLEQSAQLQKETVLVTADKDFFTVQINAITDQDGKVKATHYALQSTDEKGKTTEVVYEFPEEGVFSVVKSDAANGAMSIQLIDKSGEIEHASSWTVIDFNAEPVEPTNKLWQYVKWLTVMLGFWATMSLSISDITRYAPSQKAQKQGQFIGLPTTMMLYSFVAIFVTCASVLIFNDVLIASDAPWDPTALLGKFESPWVVIIAQVFMIIATLSTNIAANVIAPSNAFSNLFPKKISFKMGGTITGVLGILICPWWLMNDIAGILILVSGFLGPVLGIMLCDYFFIRRKQLKLAELYKSDGEYSYTNGFNMRAMISLAIGIGAALIWYLVPSLSFLSDLAWFTGFFISFIVYYVLMKKHAEPKSLTQR
ncbi:MAG: NCS1 family nucleobase:cation symporter-1 [Crocinitomicaceae bacterium]|nr:NCS1 family nucleobase:cation symporter-1 [Crocinitomicaceae bacterium]